MKEEWKALPDVADVYVSNLGRVKKWLPNHKSTARTDGWSYQKIGVLPSGTARYFVNEKRPDGSYSASSRGLAKTVYELFTESAENVSTLNPIVYIDDNPLNCNRNNLITLNELRELAVKKNILNDRKY